MVGQMPGTGLLKQFWREVQPGVEAGMTTLGKLACQLTIPASKVQHIGRGIDPFQDAFYPRLKALAGGRELQGKGLVELPVELKQA